VGGNLLAENRRLRTRGSALAGTAWWGYILAILTTPRLLTDRRGRPQRDPSIEGPGEHLRNALQLFGQVPFVGDPVFDAAVARLRRALELLEKRH
jgi:hypothetical protein